jgi:hypothetical protein
MAATRLIRLYMAAIFRFCQVHHLQDTLLLIFSLVTAFRMAKTAVKPVILGDNSRNLFRFSEWTVFMIEREHKEQGVIYGILL